MILDIIFIIAFLLLLIKGKKTIYFFPIIGVAFDIFYAYVESTPINSIYKFLIYIPLIILHLFKAKLSQFHFILIFIGYLTFVLLVSLGGEYYKPSQFITFFNVLVILLLYIVGATYFRSIQQIIKLNKSVALATFMIIVYLIIIQFIRFPLYVHDSSYSNFFKSDGFDYYIYTVSFAVIIFVFNHSINYNKRVFNLVNNILFFLSIVLLIVFMKRWAILASLIALLFFFYKTNNFLKIYKSYILYTIFFLLVTTSFLADRIISQYEVREKKMNVGAFENEGRFLDYYFMGKYLTEDAKLGDILIGGNLFETRDFGLKYLKQYRNIHPDLLQILYGLGIIGFLLYYNIYLQIYLKMKKTISNMKINREEYYLKLLHTTFLIMLAFIAIGGGAYRINTPDSIAFLYLGAIQGVLSNKHNLDKTKIL